MAAKGGCEPPFLEVTSGRQRSWDAFLDFTGARHEFVSPACEVTCGRQRGVDLPSVTGGRQRGFEPSPGGSDGRQRSKVSPH